MTSKEQEPTSLDEGESPASNGEVAQALNVDPTRLGQVWRRADKKPPEIARELGNATTSFVYNYRRTIAALVDGELPSMPTPAKLVASEASRSGTKTASLNTRSPVSRGWLNNATASRTTRWRSREKIASIRSKRKKSKRDTPGIYVYTYPHYLRHPVLPGLEHEGTGAGRQPRTYFKVGRSGRGVKERIANQMRGTAVPERPSLLRIYTIDPESELKGKEKRLHQHLRSADHGRERSQDHGTEWFLTHLEFLDDSADLLGLSTDYEPPEDDQAEVTS